MKELDMEFLRNEGMIDEDGNPTMKCIRYFVDNGGVDALMPILVPQDKSISCPGLNENMKRDHTDCME